MSNASETQQSWAARPMLSRMALLQCAAIFLISIVWQQRWGTIVDTSWLITESLRFLAGERLYVDLLENNPPFTIWFFLPAIIASKWSGVAPEIGLYVYTWLMVILGLGLAAHIIRRAGFAEGETLLRQVPLFVGLFTIFPGIAFTERDQIGAVLLLPLLALMAWRADAKGRVAPGLVLIVLTAFCGSVLVLFKPYYVFACAAPAVYVAWRRRNFWLLFSPENCLIAFIGVVYVALIFWLCPEFIRDILPQVADIYMGSGDTMWVLMRFGPTLVAILLLIWLVAPGEPISPLCVVTTLASLAAFGALIYQGKGWAYHAFPAISLGFVAVLCRIAGSPAWGRSRATVGRLALCVIVIGCSWRPFLSTQKPDANFVAAVRAASTEGATLGLIGSDMAGAHPLTRMLGTRFPSANAADWFGFLALGLSKDAAATGDTAAADRYRKLTETYLDTKYAEFARYNYDLIVVEDDQPVWTDYVFGQPRFAALMEAYRPVANDGRFTVFGRTPEGQN